MLASGLRQSFATISNILLCRKAAFRLAGWPVTPLARSGFPSGPQNGQTGKTG